MRDYTKILFRFGTAVIFFGCLSAGAVMAQQTFTVDTTSDDVSLNACTASAGDCSLRGALNRANASVATLDQINFDQSAALFGVGGTINLTNGELVIADSVSIVQTSASAPVTLDAAGSGARIFTVNAGATVSLTRLKLTNGSGGAGSGGAILNNGTLTVNQSNITNNSAAQGGGIYNNGGTLNVNRSTVSLNASSSGGGGIYNFNSAALATATVTLTNSTVSGNTTGGSGGGYFGFADLGTSQLNANNATVASNTALNGGGVAVTSNTGQTARATIDNTIIGDNQATTSGQDVFDNSLAVLPVVVPGTITSTGYNIVENTSGAGVVAQPCNASAQICDQFGVDARLLPLADNGFVFAPTHAPNTAAGVNFSPAIDKGDSALGEDQRGQMRPVDNQTATAATGGNNADIGAFEVQNAPTAGLVTVGGRVTNRSGRAVANARVSMTDAAGETRYALTNPFGFYRFQKVPAGETYVFRASAKRYEFAPQVLTVNGDADDLNFAGQ